MRSGKVSGAAVFSASPSRATPTPYGYARLAPESHALLFFGSDSLMMPCRVVLRSARLGSETEPRLTGAGVQYRDAHVHPVIFPELQSEPTLWQYGIAFVQRLQHSNATLIE